MVRGPKGFSEEEIERLRKKLCVACEKSWGKVGYRKTTIGELTKNIGIATGSFYLLFDSKEELFYQTFIQVQERLRQRWKEMIDSQRNKAGFKNAMNWLYREYYERPFLYDFANPDFIALMNRVSEGKQEEFKDSALEFLEYTVATVQMKLLVSKEKAFAAFGSLLYTVSFAENMVYDHFEIFDFLLENTIEAVFEEEN
ncbi:AcrR family transcriptional regulator [Enterococcus sp. PF1-24]|uniref:TetR/AcrR family transcriptional regulator n=1 Tax=unclassified Enterococcus TaxID=2608891 RepID=UPI002473F7D4|nr:MULTISPECIES: TetR/AcrR family transcriptional regulator [unclassified Enterococcus]MDH6364823.1 AcrR family transcriptional regulator [Enterococcus sp. PFB1-1]MDH6401953.1 AcrR family transcriptional regulator [Enterococcus sp. PF1-24]